VYSGHFEKQGSIAVKLTGGLKELTSAAGPILCPSGGGAETITGPTSVEATQVFEGCEIKGQKCQNTTTEGEIETYRLVGALFEPEPGRAAIDLTGTGSDGQGGPNEGKYYFEFACTGVAVIRVWGDLGGTLIPTNVMRSEQIEFLRGREQGWTVEFGPSFGSGTTTLPAEQIGDLETTSPFEVRVP
jgi:hypothetical protein